MMAAEYARIAPWTFFAHEYEGDDVLKLTFFAVHDDTGETVDIPLSPYARPGRKTLEQIIALDFDIGGARHDKDVEIRYLRRQLETRGIEVAA